MKPLILKCLMIIAITSTIAAQTALPPAYTGEPITELSPDFLKVSSNMFIVTRNFANEGNVGLITNEQHTRDLANVLFPSQFGRLQVFVGTRNVNLPLIGFYETNNVFTLAPSNFVEQADHNLASTEPHFYFVANYHSPGTDYLDFRVRSNGIWGTTNTQDHMLLSMSSSGNLGIGTTNSGANQTRPRERLEVRGGDINLTGVLRGNTGVSAGNQGARILPSTYSDDHDAVVFEYDQAGDTLRFRVHDTNGVDQGDFVFQNISNNFATSPAPGTTKTFVIDHPTQPQKYLVHSMTEGPETQVYYRGIARLKNGKATITLPSYFEALTRKEGRTIQLQNLDGYTPLKVRTIEDIQIQSGKFTIQAKDTSSRDTVAWMVKAIRSDVPRLVAEPKKSDITVKQIGPYTYSE